MITPEPASSGSRIPSSPTYVRALAFVLLVLVSPSFAGSARAQNNPSQPVARLISSAVNPSAYSRARRVTASAGTEAAPVTNETISSRSPSLLDANAVERRAFAETNRARTQNGLQPLAWDAELCRMAREHSESMARLSYFSHETPAGLQLKARAQANGIMHFRVIAENIAYNKGYDDPGAFAVERWMISSGHRANILYVGFQAVAIGSFVSADGSVYLTQVFIAR
jgi:uncharacterized protein YkwD